MASKTKAAQKEKEKEEAPEKEAPEAPDTPLPLLDLSDAAVKKLIRSAKKRGYVTHDQINSVLPSEEVNSEQIEDVLAMFSEMGVNVVETEETSEEGEESREEADEEGESEGGEAPPSEADFDDDDMENSLSLAAIEAELKPKVVETFDNIAEIGRAHV